MASDDDYYELPVIMRIMRGATPDSSRKTNGALRGTTRDAKGHLVGQAELFPQVDDGSNSADYLRRLLEPDTEEGAPDISSLVPLALVAVASIAAGVKVAQYLKGERETRRSQENAGGSADATPAGWYSIASDPARLRYWDGAAWTDDYAQRQSSAPSIAADWYPDPANATQLRYWDGSAWSQYVTPIRGATSTPADWYLDPSNASQLRYWDGATWTHHVTPRHGTAEVAQSIGADPAKGLASAQAEPRIRSAHAEPRMRMTSAEWQALVRSWMAAGAIQQELWRRLSTADIGDADPATLEAQRQMEKLTAEQGAHRIRLKLEANPSLLKDFGLSEFMRMFGGNGVLDHEKQVGFERS